MQTVSALGSSDRFSAGAGSVSRRGFLRAAAGGAGAVALAMPLLAACGGASVAKQQDTITFWTWFQGAHYEDNLKHLIAEYNQASPNVTVKYEQLTWEEGTQKVNVQLAAGTPPDTMFSYFNVPWITSGFMQDMDTHLTSDDKQDYGQPVLQSYTYKGKVWGLPIWKQLWNVSGNRQLLEAAGIDWKSIQQNGWTWEEFDAAAAKMTKDAPDVEGGKQYGFVYNGTWANGGLPEMWQLWNMNNGILHVVDDNGKFLYNDPRSLESLKEIVSWATTKGISPKENPALTTAKMGEMFDKWQAAMVARSGPYVIPQEQTRADKIKAGKDQGRPLEPILLPFPHQRNAKEQTSSSVPAHVVYHQRPDKGSDHLDNCLAFIRVLSSTEGCAIFSADLSEAAARTSSAKQYQKQLAMDTPNMQFFANYFDRATSPQQTLEPALAKKVTKLQSDALFPNYQAVLLGKMSPEEAVSKMASDGQKILSGPAS